MTINKYLLIFTVGIFAVEFDRECDSTMSAFLLIIDVSNCRNSARHTIYQGFWLYLVDVDHLVMIIRTLRNLVSNT